MPKYYHVEAKNSAIASKEPAGLYRKTNEEGKYIHVEDPKKILHFDKQNRFWFLGLLVQGSEAKYNYKYCTKSPFELEDQNWQGCNNVGDGDWYKANGNAKFCVSKFKFPDKLNLKYTGNNRYFLSTWTSRKANINGYYQKIEKENDFPVYQKVDFEIKREQQRHWEIYFKSTKHIMQKKSGSAIFKAKDKWVWDHDGLRDILTDIHITEPPAEKKVRPTQNTTLIVSEAKTRTSWTTESEMTKSENGGKVSIAFKTTRAPKSNISESEPEVNKTMNNQMSSVTVPVAVSLGSVVVVMALITILIVRNRKSETKSPKMSMEENPDYGEDEYYCDENGMVMDNNVEYGE